MALTRAALRERQYTAVMAATGLLYLASRTAFGMDLVGPGHAGLRTGRSEAVGGPRVGSAAEGGSERR